MTSIDSADGPLATYVTDTHALWWYFTNPQRLSVAADAVFRLAETGNARLIVPAIVVAEFYFLSVKLGQPVSPAELFSLLDTVSGVLVSELGRPQLEHLDSLRDFPETHDRLIAADAIAFDAAIVTRDRSLRASKLVATVW